MAANLLSKPTLFGPTLWLSFAVLSGSCEAPPQAIPDPMPKLEWTAPDLPTFGDNASTDFLRRRGVEALKEPLAVPDALETLLTKEDREKWRVAVEGVERYRLLAEKTIRLATSPSASTQGCDTLIGPASDSGSVESPRPAADTTALQRALEIGTLGARSAKLPRGAPWHAGGVRQRALAPRR